MGRRVTKNNPSINYFKKTSNKHLSKASLRARSSANLCMDYLIGFSHAKGTLPLLPPVYFVLFYLMLFYFVHTCGMQTFPGWGSNLRHSSDNSRSLTARPPGNPHHSHFRDVETEAERELTRLLFCKESFANRMTLGRDSRV